MNTTFFGPAIPNLGLCLSVAPSTSGPLQNTTIPYLEVLQRLARHRSPRPRDLVGPHGLAAQAEDPDEEVGQAEVEDEGAERGAVAVAEDGHDGEDVAYEAERAHHQQDPEPDGGLCAGGK